MGLFFFGLFFFGLFFGFDLEGVEVEEEEAEGEGVDFFFFGGGVETEEDWSSPWSSLVALLERVRLKWRDAVGDVGDATVVEVEGIFEDIAVVAGNAKARPENCLS